MVLNACGGDTAFAPTLQSPATTVGAIRVSPMNAVMAVGASLPFTVTGKTLTGAPVTSFDSVRYVLHNTTDTLVVAVSPAGVVTALSPSGNNNPVLLDVFTFKNGIVTAEQSIIQVTATAIPGAMLSIQPIPPDSTRLQRGDLKSITPIISNSSTGDTVTIPTVRYEYDPADSLRMACYIPQFSATENFSASQLSTSSCAANANAGQLGLNQIFGFQTGTAWVRARVNVYGVELEDSVQYTITNRFSGGVDVGPTNLAGFQESRLSIVIAPTGTISFFNAFDASFGTSIDIIFDDPSGATATDVPSTIGGSTGNIMGLTGYQGSDRKFLTAGTYWYTIHITQGVAPFNGVTKRGKVIVE